MEYMQHWEKFSVLGTYSNYFLFDFYRSPVAAVPVLPLGSAVRQITAGSETRQKVNAQL